MAVKPSITWIGSPNFGYPDGTRGQNELVAIVYHIAQGSLSGIDAWFNNPSSNASTHFAIGKSGAIHQYVNVEDAAWGNGVMNKPDTSIPWIKDCWDNGINPNLRTVSIEHEGFTGEVWPEAQYQASLALTKWLVDNYHMRHVLVIPGHGLIGHYKIDSVNRRSCPGTGWPMSRLYTDIGRWKDVYVPRNRIIYNYQTFSLPASGTAHAVTIDVAAYGYPSEASSVDLFLGCRSKGDGGYAAAYDGTKASTETLAVYPTAPLRDNWQFGRGRVLLNRSKFLLKIRPVDHPIEVIAVLKGYYTLD